MIENLRLQEDKIKIILSLSLKGYVETIQICEYNPVILSSGINKFVNTKIYLDTSTVEGVNRISGGEHITYLKRPSRANIQPVANSLLFGKMKGSNKILIITDNDKDIIKNNIFSTGFMCILSSKELPMSLLLAIIMSDNFQVQRDNNSSGTTMAGINNETFLKILVPSLNQMQINIFEEKFGHFIDRLSHIRKNIKSLNKAKLNLLNKYF